MNPVMISLQAQIVILQAGIEQIVTLMQAMLAMSGATLLITLFTSVMVYRKK